MFEIAEGPKTKLLDTALHVIRVQGHAGSSVDDICREAGVTKGSFFHRFKGKDDLAIAATEHWTGGCRAIAHLHGYVASLLPTPITATTTRSRLSTSATSRRPV